MKSSQKSITGGIYKFLILKLNSTQLNNQVEEKNASEIRKYFDMNEKKHNTLTCMRCKKIVLRGIFIAMNFYIIKKERSQINNLTLHLKE